MSKLLKNVIIGVASGAAAAYFLSTEKGKEFQKKAAKAYEAYKENPAEYHQKAKDKATEYTDLAVDTFNDYRQKFESGELTTDEFLDTVKEKGKPQPTLLLKKSQDSLLKYLKRLTKQKKLKKRQKQKLMTLSLTTHKTKKHQQLKCLRLLPKKLMKNNKKVQWTFLCSSPKTGKREGPVDLFMFEPEIGKQICV